MVKIIEKIYLLYIIIILELMEIITYDPSKDNLRSLLFPLHITSFCICDALEEESYLDADQIIIVSASSKTAIGLAQGLKDSEQTQI